MVYTFNNEEENDRVHLSSVCLLVIYCLLIICFTVLIRKQSFEGVRLSLFWSYYEWFTGDSKIGIQILGNILLFFPFGYLASACLRKNKYILLLGLVLSITIEISQYITMRGLFEFDDIIHNSLGTVLGVVAYKRICLVKSSRCAENIALILGVIAILFSTAMCMLQKQDDADSSSRNYCIQIESVTSENDEVELTGFALWFDHYVGGMKMALRSTDGKDIIPLDVKYGLDRVDVQDYFLCDFDYTRTGFIAKGHMSNWANEYEILVSLDWPQNISTGIFIEGTSIHYYRSDSFMTPTTDTDKLREIIDRSVLRYYSRDDQCWVYQDRENLYWIFANDSALLKYDNQDIQYQIWTTQVERLPSYRLDNGWDWDERNGSFEDFELNGVSELYRILCRRLPSDYSIKSVLTGYYVDDSWVWKTYFRPIYYFDEIPY